MRGLGIALVGVCMAGCALGGSDCVANDARCLGTVRQVCVAGAGWQPAEDCVKRGAKWECRNDGGPVGAACVRWRGEGYRLGGVPKGTLVGTGALDGAAGASMSEREWVRINNDTPCGMCSMYATVRVRGVARCWACAMDLLVAENARLTALVEAHELTFRALDAAVKERKEGR